MTDTEREHVSSVPEGVTEIPDAPEIPSHIEKAGVQNVPSQFTKQVTDDNGKPMTQSPSTQQVTISIPATAQQLDDWTKGSPTESITWLAVFWLRLIKKAMHFGWNILSGKVKNS